MITFESELPEGAIESCAIAVVGWLDDEANLRYSLVHRGDVPLSTYIGLMEMAKCDLYAQAQEEWQ